VHHALCLAHLLAIAIKQTLVAADFRILRVDTRSVDALSTELLAYKPAQARRVQRATVNEAGQIAICLLLEYLTITFHGAKIMQIVGTTKLFTEKVFKTAFTLHRLQIYI